MLPFGSALLLSLLSLDLFSIKAENTKRGMPAIRRPIRLPLRVNLKTLQPLQPLQPHQPFERTAILFLLKLPIKEMYSESGYGKTIPIMPSKYSLTKKEHSMNTWTRRGRNTEKSLRPLQQGYHSLAASCHSLSNKRS